MRLLALLLVCAAGAQADTLYAKQGGRPFASDVMIVERKDGKIYYFDKSLKQRSFPEAMVGRVAKKKTDIHVYFEKLEAAKDADAVMALAGWATGKKFRDPVITGLWERALELDADHEGANTALGRVQHEGEWMTPAEKAKRIADADAAAMAEKGFVRWKDQWVTPEDKAQLEKGLIKHDGKWMTEEEIKAEQGLVKHEGKWIPKADLAIARMTSRARKETGLGEGLKLVQTEHFAIFGDLQPAQMAELAKTLTRLLKEFTRICPDADPRQIAEDKYRMFVFRKGGPYKRFVKERFKRMKAEEGWSERYAKAEEQRMKLRLRETSFWEIQPHAMSAHIQMPDPFEGLKSHCVHFAANVFVTRYQRTRFMTWWLNESLAYYLEAKCTGGIQTFSADLGGVKYADQAPDGAIAPNPWLDATKWKGLIKGLVQRGQDPKLGDMKSKQLFGQKNRLRAQDLAKGFSVVTYLIRSDPKKFAAFLHDAKVNGPRDPVEREVSAVIKHYGSYEKIDEGWRAYVNNGFRLAR